MTNNLQEKPLIQVENLITVLNEFALERDWKQFHSPKNLTMALSGEVGELVSLFQWLTEQESYTITNDVNKKKQIENEIADVFIYLTQLCSSLNIDINDSVINKIDTNKKNYPIEKFKGNSKKYNES